MTGAISCALLPSSFAISRKSPEHPDIAELLKLGTDFANKIRPSHLNFFLNVTELKADGVHIYTARQIQGSLSSAQGRALGMAGLAPISANFELGKAVEIKRMRVHAAARGQGMDEALVKFLEKEALKGGYERVMLETGYDFVEARKLYEKLGYTYIERFGAYKRSEQSLCMQIWLKADRQDGG
jgi:putative acetyltransferase